MEKKYGLIFDVDGVIADTERVNADAAIQMFSNLFGMFGVRRESFEAGLGRGALEYIRSAARVHGMQLSKIELDQAIDARQTLFLEMLKENPLPAFPGVLELIEQARSHSDFCVGIATSSTREKSEAVLRSAKVPYSEMVYVNGSDVKIKKPDPALFLRAAERLGVSPARCVVIEDAPNGVAAAKAAGCYCIAVTNSVALEKLTEADLVVESLIEVDVMMVASLID